MLSGPEAEAANVGARFYPVDTVQEDSPTLPCIEIAGVQVYVYFRDGELTISAHFDTAFESTQRPDQTVPLRVNIGGTDVFTG